MPWSPSGSARHLGSLLSALALALAPCSAQTAPPRQPGQPLTLSVQSRLVVEDVLVFDRAGHPVFGLPASAFHLTDNDHPQSLRSFEEGSTAPAPAAPNSPLPPGTFQNLSNATDHTASAVLLIDADSMSLPDQMYLLGQLGKSLDALPPGLAVAVFRVSNTRVVQLRSLETDRADLHRALSECLPVITRPLGDHFQSAVDQLLTVSAYLQQTPGRKNILWFAGAFPLVSLSAEEANQAITPDVDARLHIIHQLQEELAEARVSVYPIDVRGVISIAGTAPAGYGAGALAATRGAGGSPNPAAAAVSTPTTSTVLGLPASSVMAERAEMHQLASSTGGRAYTLNHLAPEITEAFTLGLRAYALTYSPSPYQNDDSWHQVRIAVDTPPGVAGPLSLAYRPGYLATWSGVAGGRAGVKLGPAGSTVAAGGSTTETAPLAFEVHIAPGSPDPAHPRNLPLALQFTIPIQQLRFQHTGAGWRDQLVVASYVYTAAGRIRTGHMQQFNTTFSDAQWAAAESKKLPASQTLTVPPDAHYLMLELRDTGNGRAGSLMLPVRALRSLAAATPQAPAGTAQSGTPPAP